MRCPKFNCGSDQLITIETRDSEALPQRLAQYNLKRRRRRCKFGHKFFTVELTEEDFDKLISERGRLEPLVPGVRSPAKERG